MTWKLTDAADQTGRVAIVTGATSGLGLETAAALAGLGAHVVLTARSEAKGASALAEVRRRHHDASAEVGTLDLASLATIAPFAADVMARHGRIDLLVNNAGVMATPFQRTADGFELQIGTNHLGHVALTAALLPALQAAESARVVTVSSMGHRPGHIDLDDLNFERRRYLRWPAYFQSKLANLLFAFELDRRLRAASADADDASPAVASLAAHPGGSQSHLGVGYGDLVGRAQSLLFALGKPLMMPTAQGALPQLRAALDPMLPSGTYVGPDGFNEMRGQPVVVRAKASAYDEQLAARLWDLSCELTGATFPW